MTIRLSGDYQIKNKLMDYTELFTLVESSLPCLDNLNLMIMRMPRVKTVAFNPSRVAIIMVIYDSSTTSYFEIGIGVVLRIKLERRS